ncbi:hypothetical protein FRC07_002123 [Ceratobasidium sp. 392]|nr:hypothetical protein FRC07_002123 [Ceratobasidium sp. 392]
MSLYDGAYRIFSPLKTESGNFRVIRLSSEEPGVSSSGGVDNTLKSRPEAFEWTIDIVGPGQFRVHVPGQDLYWQIADAVQNEVKITLSKSENKNNEIWVFSWADRESLP